MDGSRFSFGSGLRDAVSVGGEVFEEEGNEQWRREEGAVDCTETVLRLWGFRSMLCEGLRVRWAKVA